MYNFNSLRCMKSCIPFFEPSAKKHLPFFSCFVKKILYFKKLHTSLVKIIQASWNILRSYRKIFCCLSNEATFLLNLSCVLVRFSLLQNILQRSRLYPLLVSHAICCMMLMLCKMMWWCYVMQNDILCRRYAHSCNGAQSFVSILTFSL